MAPENTGKQFSLIPASGMRQLPGTEAQVRLGYRPVHTGRSPEPTQRPAVSGQSQWITLGMAPDMPLYHLIHPSFARHGRVPPLPADVVHDDLVDHLHWADRRQIRDACVPMRLRVLIYQSLHRCLCRSG